MSRTDVAPAVERILKPIQQFVRGWMTTPLSDARARELGLRSGHDFWIIGRAGVMGDGDAEVAVAVCAAWGTAKLSRFDPDRMTRLDGYGRRIANAASPALGPVFAGWRALPQPDDIRARVSLTVQVLREMRGAAHISAINACALTPLDAILASTAAPPRTGPEYAAKMG